MTSSLWHVAKSNEILCLSTKERRGVSQVEMFRYMLEFAPNPTVFPFAVIHFPNFTFP